ncbi:MAG: hypothetical protein RIR11_3356 [Bacteroidota bacterium]|jgi:NodT family efflux transporter outer membrane factor (OMF) lipoprotein
MLFYKKNYCTIFVIATTFGFLSCKVPKLPTAQTLRPMPKTFATVSDSTNEDNITWRNFFGDTYLIALVEEALQNNPDIQMASARIQMANAQVTATRGALRPTMAGGVIPSLRRFGFYTMDGAGNATTDIEPGRVVPKHLPDVFVGLQSSWEIDAFHKLRNQKKAAILRFLASQEGRNLIQTNLIAEVALGYFDLLALDNQLVALLESIALQQQVLDIVSIQKESGVTTELSVKQFEAQVLNAQAQVSKTRQAITETENLLNFLLGRFAQPIARDTQFLEKVLPKTSVGIPPQLLKNRPDIRQAELELAAASADVSAARAAFFPTISLTGSLGVQAFNPALLIDPQSLAYGLFGGLMQPLFNKTAIESAYHNATAEQNELFFKYQKSLFAATVEVSNELARLDNLQTMFDLKKSEATMLRQSIEIANDLFRSGRANYLELLTAQQNLLAAQLELFYIKNEQFAAAVNLYKSLGGGWK